MKIRIVDPFIEIKKEIEKQPENILEEFMVTFPCERKNYFIPIPKSRVIIIKGRRVRPSFSFPVFSATWSTQYLNLPKNDKDKKDKYVICADAPDFWKRWNRFKKLKIFL